MSARLPVQPWVPQSKAHTQQMDQRQVIKIIKENSSYGSTLKTFGFCRLELKKAEKVYAKAAIWRKRIICFFLGQDKN